MPIIYGMRRSGKKLYKVLLVDDDKVANSLAKKVIERTGLVRNISVVTNGEKALNYLLNPQKTFPELIFLDIAMPIMDGFQFLKKFRKTHTSAKEITRIIILSSLYNEDELKDIAGFDEVIGYMQKPLDEEKVQKAVEHYFKKLAFAK